MMKIKEIGIFAINQKAKQIKNCIRFDKGSVNFSFPKEVFSLFNHLIKKLKKKYSRYSVSGGERDLKIQIANFEKRNGRLVLPENIVITHGGMSGFFLVFSLILKPGDEIIANKYCFEGFSLLAQHFRLIQKRVNLSSIRDLEKTSSNKTKLIILNSPENPTGKVYTQEEIEAIIGFAKKKKIWILSHEGGNSIVYPPNKWYGPGLDYERLIITNSFSKLLFLPGIRIGWMISKNKDLIENVRRLIAFQTLGINIFDQVFTSEILRTIDYDFFIERRLKILRERKNLLERELKKANLEYLPVQGGTNFYVNLKKDTQRLLPKALKKKVAFIPGYFFEDKKSTFARIGFGEVKKEEIQKGIKIIAKLI